MSNLPDDDLVTRLLNSDGRVDELLKEAAGYIITLRHSLVVLNNQLSKESQRGQCVIWPHQERLLQQRIPSLFGHSSLPCRSLPWADYAGQHVQTLDGLCLSLNTYLTSWLATNLDNED